VSICYEGKHTHRETRGLASVSHQISASSARSWLQDTLKRKLFNSAWNRRYFYLPGACSPFFGSTRLNVSINSISGALVFINRRVNLGLIRGNRNGGARKRSKHR